MPRRRETRDEATEAFLDASPTLIEFETHIEVAQDSRGRHVLEVTMDGEEPELTEAPKFNLFKAEGSLPGLITLDKVVEGENFELSSSYESYDRRGNLVEKDGRVALSDLGIGVTSGGDVKGIIKGIFRKTLDEDDLQKFATTSSNEALKLSVDEIPHEGSEGPEERPEFFLDHGGKSIDIDFDIVSGSGTVQIVLIDENTGRETIHEFETEVPTGRGRRTELVDHIEAVMGGGATFEEVEIRTTGDLEINVIGIDMTTGYVDFADFI